MNLFGGSSQDEYDPSIRQLHVLPEDRQNLRDLHDWLEGDDRDISVVGSAMRTTEYDDIDVMVESKEFFDMPVPEYRAFLNELDVVADDVEEVDVSDRKGVYGGSHLEARYRLDVGGTEFDLLCTTNGKKHGPWYEF